VSDVEVFHEIFFQAQNWRIIPAEAPKQKYHSTTSFTLHTEVQSVRVPMHPAQVHCFQAGLINEYHTIRGEIIKFSKTLGAIPKF
jgi:hypothetical protein